MSPCLWIAKLKKHDLLLYLFLLCPQNQKKKERWHKRERRTILHLFKRALTKLVKVRKLGNSEQWLPFSAVGNLLVNCQLTGYWHITNSWPTVLSRPKNWLKIESKLKKVYRNMTIALFFYLCTWFCLNGKISLFNPSPDCKFQS